MSTTNSEHDPRPAHDELQFDQAEYSAGAGPAPDAGPACAACKTPIADVYYEAGGHLVCANCCERFGQGALQGGRLGRAFKALVLGSIAAAVGAGAYYAIMKMTGLNIGLVAVVVGVMVGGAVKSGSGNRGGWFYQFLALFLTYTSIASMYAVPGIVQAFGSRDARPAAEKNQGPVEDAPAVANAEGKKAAEADKPKAAKPAPVGPDGKELRMSPLRAFVVLGGLLLLLIGFSYSIPVQIAVASPISGLIFSFALWEAWKINRRVDLAFEGPFRLAASGK